MAPGEKRVSISEKARKTSCSADLKAETEQKTLISQAVSKKKSVEVCHFSLTPQLRVNKAKIRKKGKSFLANDCIDGPLALNF